MEATATSPRIKIVDACEILNCSVSHVRRLVARKVLRRIADNGGPPGRGKKYQLLRWEVDFLASHGRDELIAERRKREAK